MIGSVFTRYNYIGLLMMITFFFQNIQLCFTNSVPQYSLFENCQLLQFKHLLLFVCVQMVRTTVLKVLHGMFTSIAGPQGLNSDLCAQLVSVCQSSHVGTT